MRLWLSLIGIFGHRHSLGSWWSIRAGELNGHMLGFDEIRPGMTESEVSSILARGERFAEGYQTYGKLESVTLIQYFVVKKGDKVMPVKGSAFKITKELKKEGDKCFLIITRTPLDQYKTPDGYSLGPGKVAVSTSQKIEIKD